MALTVLVASCMSVAQPDDRAGEFNSEEGTAAVVTLVAAIVVMAVGADHFLPSNPDDLPVVCGANAISNWTSCTCESGYTGDGISCTRVEAD